MHRLRFEIKLAEDGWVSFYALRGHKITSERHCQPSEADFMALYLTLQDRPGYAVHRSLVTGNLIFIKQTKL